MTDIEKVIENNVTPKTRTSDDDCAVCALYNYADICRRFACTNSQHVFAAYWATNKHDEHGKPVLNKDFINCIMNESAERVRFASRAILDKSNGGR